LGNTNRWEQTGAPNVGKSKGDIISSTGLGRFPKKHANFKRVEKKAFPLLGGQKRAPDRGGGVPEAKKNGKTQRDAAQDQGYPLGHQKHQTGQFAINQGRRVSAGWDIRRGEPLAPMKGATKGGAKAGKGGFRGPTETVRENGGRGGG